MLEPNELRMINGLRRWIIAVFVLCILNFLLVFLLYGTLPNSSQTTISAPAQSLPKGLVRPEQREKLFRDYADAYNARDYHRLAGLMSPVFNVENPEEKLPDIMQKLYKLADSIQDGAFDHFTVAPDAGSGTGYELFYRLRVSGGRPGTLNLHVVQQGSDPFQVSGFRITAE